MRPELLRRSGRTIAGLAIVCLTAGSLLPGSAPAAAVADHAVTAAAPAVEYQPLPAPEPVVEGTDSAADSPSSKSSLESESGSPEGIEKATETVTPSDVPASAPTVGSRPADDTTATKRAASTTPSSDTAAKNTAAKKRAATKKVGSSTAASKASAPLPQIAAAPALHLTVPTIGVDAAVQPVDSVPTGETNAFGGPVYSPIDFPVDADVRQWIRRGDPNSIAPAEAAADVRSFDRVVLYGHASDIGNQLVFQDLSQVALGDPIEVRTANGTFTYRVTLTATNDKATLDAMPELYDYPRDGRKEIALVACLPDTSSNAVVIGVLVGAATH